jgi:small redox-active disulfide protein 2
MIIKILGSGCTRCHKLFNKVTTVVNEHQIKAGIIKTDDIKEFAKYGIMLSPALVINEKLKCSINIPSEKQILKYISEEL